jgi:hypothetical protein
MLTEARSAPQLQTIGASAEEASLTSLPAAHHKVLASERPWAMHAAFGDKTMHDSTELEDPGEGSFPSAQLHAQC